jgi:hypothetical protein
MTLIKSRESSKRLGSDTFRGTVTASSLTSLAGVSEFGQQAFAGVDIFITRMDLVRAIQEKIKAEMPFG